MEKRAVDLSHMLEARERRYWKQQELLSKYKKTLLCFTMNIAGPIKNNDLILRGFRKGQQMIQEQLELAGIKVIHTVESTRFTGNEAFYVLDALPLTVKQLTTEIEDHSSIGRLFDMDVLNLDGSQISRKELGLSERKCLICGGPAKVCSSRRVHSAAELQSKTTELLHSTFRKEDSETVAQLAVQSLLYEVCTTPKPGLVDRSNSGSHQDMDIFTFMASSAALFPYFAQCAQIGMDTATLDAPETFRRLRWPGKRAESVMKEATGGVNTHKGAIFSLGILCGALGRLGREQWHCPETVLHECAAMTKGLTQEDFAGITAENAQTVGQKLYVQYGITGVRGQAEQGFPAVLNAGLPALKKALSTGHCLNDAGCHALMAIIIAATDTNLIARSNRETQLRVTEQLKVLEKRFLFFDRERLEWLDAAFMKQNLSPGGSADLLAMTYFLHALEEL